MSAIAMQIIATIMLVGFIASINITIIIGVFAAIRAANKDKSE